jgi:hypothetical protein
MMRTVRAHLIRNVLVALGLCAARLRGDQLAAQRRFLTCYSVLYLLDVIALWVVAGQMGVLHQIVQGCMILMVALLTFMLQKYWVSSAAAGSMGESATRIS